jgi:glycerophosphoryl diester phosphodiesterase
MTKDKVILVCHDETFERVCGIKHKVIDTNYTDIPMFKDRLKLNFGKKGQHYLRKEGD